MNHNVSAPTGRKYRVYSWKRRPIVAIPEGSRSLRLASVARLQPTSPLKATFRAVHSVVIRMHLDQRFGKTTQIPIGPGFNLNEWLDEAEQLLDIPELHACVFWPAQPSRKRVYIHLLDRSGESAGFAKVSLDAGGHDAVQNEYRALTELAQFESRRLQIPIVLASGSFGRAWHLITEALPAQARPIRCASLSFDDLPADEFSGTPRSLNATQVRELDWWKPAHACCSRFPTFTAELNRSLSDGLAVCRVHGDFGPANVAVEDSRIWVVDWESSHAMGPRATDRVSFFIGTQFRYRNQPAMLMKGLRQEFTEAGLSRKDLIASLAFLGATGHETVLELLRFWESDR